MTGVGIISLSGADCRRIIVGSKWPNQKNMSQASGLEDKREREQCTIPNIHKSLKLLVR